MRKQFLIASILMLSFTLMSSTCSSDDDNSGTPDNSAQIMEIENISSSGSWRITNFNDSGQDETSDFAGYNFTFGANNTLTATNGTTTVTGTWSITDDSNSSSSSDDIDFNIFFPVPEENNFEDLNDDWDIATYTQNKIELIDISGGNGGTDLLTFEKN